MFKKGEDMAGRVNGLGKKKELFGIIQSTLEMADYDFKVRVVLMLGWVFSLHLELPTGLLIICLLLFPGVIYAGGSLSLGSFIP